jgi:hypothetical protein
MTKTVSKISDKDKDKNYLDPNDAIPNSLPISKPLTDKQFNDKRFSLTGDSSMETMVP